MTYPNPTLTWKQSGNYQPSTATSGASILKALADAVTETTTNGWTVVDGGNGTVNYLVLKPSNTTEEYAHMRAVFAVPAGNMSGGQLHSQTNTSYAQNRILLSFAPDARDAANSTAHVDTAGSVSNFETADIWANVATDKIPPMKFYPCVPILSSYSIEEVSIISSEEILCVRFRDSANHTRLYPCWLGATISPLGSPGAGDSIDRVYGCQMAGSRTADQSSSWLTAAHTYNNMYPFRNYYHSSSYPSYGNFLVWDERASAWVTAIINFTWNSSFLIGYGSYGQATNRDFEGNIDVSRVPIIRHTTSTGDARCFGHLRQIYPWSNQSLDRQVIGGTGGTEQGFVVAPSKSTGYESWVMLNS